MASATSTLEGVNGRLRRASSPWMAVTATSVPRMSATASAVGSSLPSWVTFSTSRATWAASGTCLNTCNWSAISWAGITWPFTVAAVPLKSKGSTSEESSLEQAAPTVANSASPATRRATRAALTVSPPQPGAWVPSGGRMVLSSPSQVP